MRFSGSKWNRSDDGMLLALSVLGPQGAELGPLAYKVFDDRGGSIGRQGNDQEGNDWILPDPDRFLSTRHATVSFENGTWRLRDVSTNGTYINDPEQAVSRDEPMVLREGDHLFIGGYEILVQLIELEAPATSEGAPANPPDAPALDVILRTVVQGLMAVLQSRAEIKSQFRMSMTSVRPVENNPLKLSRTAEDALQRLFGEGNPGYMTATEAFREAFDDISFHQVAMLAGVRGAYNAMLASLHPDKLEARYARRLKRASFVSLFGRLRYWSMYRAQFEEIESDPEAHFQNLFGEEFARTYAEQLQLLQAARRQGAR
jgi:predicted component of type VI protein secretion system